MSNSDVIFADLIEGKTKVPVALKIFADITTLKEHDDTTEFYLNDIGGLKYEIKVYRDIISEILEKRYSPNFVAYIGSGTCPMKNVSVFDENIEESVASLYEESRLYGDKIEDLPLKILITRRPGGKDSRLITFKEFYTGRYFWEDELEDLDEDDDEEDEKEEIEWEEKMNVWFQIIYSIAVMQRYRLVHNDLHASNILIAILKEKKTLYYFIGKTVFKIKTKYIPYLFDWDMAYSSFLGKNPKNEDKHYLDLNIRNRFSEKSDLFKLFCHVGFKSPIADLYATSRVAFYKPEDISFDIDEKTLEILKKETCYFKRANTCIYKMGYIQLSHVFGDKVARAIIKKAKSPTIFFERHNKTIKIIYHSDYCVPLTIKKNFPTPLDILKNEFNHLKTNLTPRDLEDKNKGGSIKFYKFPLHSVSSRKAHIFIDKKIPSTRHKIKK